MQRISSVLIAIEHKTDVVTELLQLITLAYLLKIEWISYKIF